MFSMIPFPVKISIIIAIILGAVGFGYMKGKEGAKIAIANYQAESEKQIADLEKQNSEISNKVVTQYVDKINTVKEKEYVYVDAAKNSVPNQYELSNGWVYTHDASVTNGNADTTGSSDAAASGVKDNQALATIIGNYSVCIQNANQLTSLQQWIIDNQKAISDSNNKETDKKKKRFGLF